MAFLPAPTPADFPLTIGSPTVSWNTGNDSVIVSYRGSGLAFNGIGQTPAAGWTRVQAELVANGGTLQAGSQCYAALVFKRNAAAQAVSFGYRCETNGANGLYLSNWNNITGSLSGTVASVPISRPRFLKVEADATGFVCSWSDDWDDIGYVPLPAAFSATWASFLGGKPDRIYVAVTGDSVFTGGGGTNLVNLVGWKVE